MKSIVLVPFLLLSLVLMSGCAGIKYMNIETQEPAQVTLPSNIRSVLIVDNVVKQPSDIGHFKKKIGRKDYERVNVSSDSVSTFYTEALTQFLTDENYFDRVILHNKPLRIDNNYWDEMPISPETLNQLRIETGADAIISLDKLLVQTQKQDYFVQQDYPFGMMTGRIQSVIRAYLPTMDGKIPSIQFNDSIRWEGFDIQDGRAYAEQIIPTQEEGMKMLAVYAAEKMTNVFVPHWEMQNRWYYTLPSSIMKEGEVNAAAANWSVAIEKWKSFYNNSNKKLDRAKAASNIALAYEMIGDMNKAFEWISLSKKLFEESASNSSLDTQRAQIYLNEIERRRDNSNKLDMQLTQ